MSIVGRVPQVIVTLMPDGTLAAELPGPGPTRRKIELAFGKAEQTLLRILAAQLLERDWEIGLDSAPTSAQVKHWEKHGEWPRERCRFCLAEGRISAADPLRAKRTNRLIERRSDGVEIKRIPARSRGPEGPIVVPKGSGKRAINGPEDLGL